MTEQQITYETEDKTTVAPEVLVKIARMAALEVDGVARMAQPPGGHVRGWLQRNVGDGVTLRIINEAIEIELYLAIHGNQNVMEISRTVQAKVVRAMEKMVGLNVTHVNINVEDIVY